MAEEHYCSIHNTVFFKTEKMRGYAHPIKDKNEKTIGWCNEEDLEKLKNLEPEGKDKILPEHQEVIDEAKASVKEMTKADWAEKNRIERQSIQRQTALKQAVNWCSIKVQGGGEIKTIEVITVASVFESYLEHGLQVKKK